MQKHHWIMIVVVFVVGYLAGVWKPQYGAAVIGKLQGA